MRAAARLQKVARNTQRGVAASILQRWYRQRLVLAARRHRRRTVTLVSRTKETTLTIAALCGFLEIAAGGKEGRKEGRLCCEQAFHSRLRRLRKFM